MSKMNIDEYRSMVAAQLNGMLSRKDMLVSVMDNGPSVVFVEAIEPTTGKSVETTWNIQKSFKDDFISGGHIRLAKQLLKMLSTRGVQCAASRK